MCITVLLEDNNCLLGEVLFSTFENVFYRKELCTRFCLACKLVHQAPVILSSQGMFDVRAPNEAVDKPHQDN